MIPHPARSVLIVEDERIVAMDLQQTLHELGYDAFAIASSAEEAIARASERCPDLVLMDIRIKGERDGIETAAILKTKFAVPVVYLTAHADEGTLDRAKKTEPHGYLLKPVRSAELRSVVEVSLYKYELEKRLRERERWFSTTLRSIADAVITVDLAGNVTFMNLAAEALTGAKADLAAGKPIREVLHLVGQTDDDSPALRALREGRSVELQEGNLRNLSSGSWRTIHDSAAPVVDQDQTLGAVMVFRDVTDQKKLQRQVELSDRLASLGTMAAGVAHEINNPLAVVVANSRFLTDDLNAMHAARPASELSAEEEQRFEDMTQTLQDLQVAARRIGRIVSDLRAFSRPPEPTSANVDVRRCVEWAIRTTSHEFRHRAKLIISLGEVPPVAADETRLGQVLINLLVNAAQAISPGSADQNEIGITTRVGSDGRAIVEVRDTGSGISQKVLARIFEPFFTTKAVGVGTGLGLSICHGIVSSLGGEITVTSELGKGTLVQVFLPPCAPEQSLPGAPVAEPANALRGHILVVDDEDLVLRALKRVLRDHQLRCVHSAQDALTLLEQGESFDLIFTDLIMPTMTGISFYETLLARHPEHARRVVFLSGGAITARVEDFLRSVRNPRIEKPFDVGSLRETVQRLLAEQKA